MGGRSDAERRRERPRPRRVGVTDGVGTTDAVSDAVGVLPGVLLADAPLDRLAVMAAVADALAVVVGVPAGVTVAVALGEPPMAMTRMAALLASATYTADPADSMASCMGLLKRAAMPKPSTNPLVL